MRAIEGVNENKAVQGIVKPKLLRLGNGRTEEILYKIIQQFWYERTDKEKTILNKSQVTLLHKNGDKTQP